LAILFFDLISIKIEEGELMFSSFSLYYFCTFHRQGHRQPGAQLLPSSTSNVCRADETMMQVRPWL
jgi:hypothetical protein